MRRFGKIHTVFLLTALLSWGGGAQAQTAKGIATQPKTSLFQEMDNNADGRVTHEEFMAFYREAFAGLQKDGRGNATVGTLNAYYTARFKQLDKNGDGTITADEYGTPGIDANGDGRTTLEEWSAFFTAQVKVMDADRDGKVSPGEYTAYCEAYFKAADKDGDGVIVVREWMSPRSPARDTIKTP